MTTLNTIIEEEEKNIIHKYDLRYFDGSTYAVTEEFEKDLTTAIQRAYEEGRKSVEEELKEYADKYELEDVRVAVESLK